MRILFYFTLFLIAYGSFYPFNFEYFDYQNDEILALLLNNEGVFRLSDLIANVVLFVPFGFFGFLKSKNQKILNVGLLNLLVGGLLFSFILQLIQIYLPGRIVALSDVIWNLVGLFVGLFLALFFQRSSLLSGSRLSWLTTIPGILIVFWLAAELIPFVPTLQFDLVRDNVKALMASTIHSNEIIFQLVAWLVCLYWIVSLTTKYSVFYGTAIFTLCAKFFLVDSHLDLNSVIAIVCALALGKPVIGYIKSSRQDEVLSLLIIIAISLDSLAPFSFNEQLNDFKWLPFSGFLEGSMSVNSYVLCKKIFIYGSLLWTLKLSSGKLKLSTGIVVFWVLTIELLQIIIGNHTPEITDPILVLLLAYTLNYIDKKLVQQDVSPVPRFEKPVASGKTSLFTFFAEGSYGSFKPMIISAIVVLVGFTLAIKAILSIPGIPYNIREMFLGNGNILAIFVFALVLLWVGMSGVFCAHLTAKQRFQFIAFPGFVLISGLISLALLYLSVTEETIADIAGSTNLNWQVQEGKVWGESAAKVFRFLNMPTFISFFERIVRYLALYSPVVFILTLCNLVINSSSKRRFSDRAVHFLILLAVVLPWLYLCKLIAFTYSSTDNLNEIIARPGEYNLGGGGYLYLLLILLCANSVFLARVKWAQLQPMLLVLLFTLLAVPLGWYLLNAGLVTDFSKYGYVYSGVDFLLGPDRTTLLSNFELFFRWSVVQLALVGGLSYGQRVMQAVNLSFGLKPA